MFWKRKKRLRKHYNIFKMVDSKFSGKVGRRSLENLLIPEQKINGKNIDLFLGDMKSDKIFEIGNRGNY